MFPYIPITSEEEKEMLGELGISSVAELFYDIADDLKVKGSLKLPNSKSELEVRSILNGLANKNLNTNEAPCFLGAGAYDHYIPSIIGPMVQRTEFLTSYTPYQPEISQGTLQYIFEFQSLISRLTGLPIANASLYDGATSAAEAVTMCAGLSRKKKVLVSTSINPDHLDVIRTYCHMQQLELIEIKSKDGKTDIGDLKDNISDDIGSVVVQSPNFFGIIEDVEALAEVAHQGKKASFILSTDPISLGMLKKPGDMGVDICVGEGQSLGIPLAFGGPYLGYFTCTEKYLRKIPGRIVGETVDRDGKRSFVLTLTAREQHIRREKATSNICSNQGLNCLAAAMYMSMMGKKGLREVAVQSNTKARYLAEQLEKSGLFKLVYNDPFFIEFAAKTDIDTAKIKKAMLDAKIIGPLALEDKFPERKGEFLFAVTEKRTKEEIDRLVEVLGGLK